MKLIQLSLLVSVFVTALLAQSVTSSSTAKPTTPNNANIPGTETSKMIPTNAALDVDSQGIEESIPITPKRKPAEPEVPIKSTEAEVPIKSPADVKPAEPKPSIENRVQCSGTVVRKEIRQMMADGDFGNFVKAFKRLAKDGTLAEFVNLHSNIAGGYWTHAHFTPRFLPFHRIFLYQFEQKLIAAGAKYIPYWNWGLDSQQPWKSPILTGDFLGSPNAQGVIVTSEFARGKYSSPIGGVSLVRNYNPEGPTPVFHHPSLVDKIIREASQFSEFSKQFEYGPHAGVHSILGGDTGDLRGPRSPNDPIFWVHHAFCDMLWHRYQMSGRPGAREFEGNAYKQVMDENELILPYKVPVKNLLSIDDVCVRYEATSEAIRQGATGLRGENGNISAPAIADNWMNNAGADQQFAKKLEEEAEVFVKTVNKDIKEGRPVVDSLTTRGAIYVAGNFGFKVGSSVLMIAGVSLLFAMF